MSDRLSLLSTTAMIVVFIYLVFVYLDFVCPGLCLSGGRILLLKRDESLHEDSLWSAQRAGRLSGGYFPAAID